MDTTLIRLHFTTRYIAGQLILTKNLLSNMLNQDKLLLPQFISDIIKSVTLI